MSGRGLVIVIEQVDCGGTERVMEVLADRYPQARIVALHFSELLQAGVPAGAWARRARLVPGGRRKRHFLAPLYARRLARAHLDSGDVVLALAHHGWSLAAAVPPGARLVCYSAGLPKALYGGTSDYLRAYPPPLRPLLRGALPALRAHERRLMRRPDRLLANSRDSAQAIARVHGRRAEVVHPPVRTEFFTPPPDGGRGRRHVLAVARLVAHKRLDVLMRAFHGLDAELVVVGRGPDETRLRRLAPANVSFAGWIPDTRLRELYRGAFALACPSVEEFGIVMAEAHACGVPVIAPCAGGAREVVDDPRTGRLLDPVDPPALRAAIRSARDGVFDPDACRASAERFSEQRFLASVDRALTEEAVQGAAEHHAPAPVLAT